MTFLKNRPQGKKMGIILLVALIAISVAEVIFRAVAMGIEAVLTTANLGEQLAVIALAVTLIIMTAIGKDRASYILFGAWIAYFVLDQLFELPGVIVDMIFPAMPVAQTHILAVIAFLSRLGSMFFIIAIGVLLVEYMNDGTIYNRAFNTLSIVAVLLIAVSIVGNVISVIGGMPVVNLLSTFNSLYRLVMVFMFAFFAYDSAKAQLKKANLTK
jgi:hypothetical protein